jgi:hypothetical protein
MDSLWLRGLRGKKSTPSVGWEVLVMSDWLARGRWTEHTWDRDSELSHLATVRWCIFVLNGSLNIVLAPSVMYFYYVKIYVLFNVTLPRYFILFSTISLDEPKVL